jgi:hypothetical protein
MHSFYFAIQCGDVNGQQSRERVQSIQESAAGFGLSCHAETHGDTVTLQIETNDLPSAVAFKLASERALYEEHE